MFVMTLASIKRLWQCMFCWWCLHWTAVSAGDAAHMFNGFDAFLLLVFSSNQLRCSPL